MSSLFPKIKFEFGDTTQFPMDTLLSDTSLLDPQRSDRKKRSRERNRVHAKKTRERKKVQMQSLQLRIKQLQREESYLRRLVEERDTAQVLLSMSGGSCPKSRENASSEAKFNDNLEVVLFKLQQLEGAALSEEEYAFEMDSNILASSKSKMSAQERQMLRRERNRMHAKRTRDRKKLFYEASSLIIRRMEGEIARLVHKLGPAACLPSNYAIHCPTKSTLSVKLEEDDRTRRFYTHGPDYLWDQERSLSSYSIQSFKAFSGPKFNASQSHSYRTI